MGMMEQKTKEVTIEEYPEVRITVREATALDGMRRMILLNETRLEEKDEGEGESKPLDVLGFSVDTALAKALLRRVYSVCLACMVECEGLDDLSFEGFSRLPEQIVVAWENAALGLNPHWRWWSEGDETEEQAEEKKAPGPAASETLIGDS